MGVLNRAAAVMAGSPNIGEQLGCPINEDPGPDLRALYGQLLVGLHLIAQGNNYPGYALVYNDGIGEAEIKLLEIHLDSIVQLRKLTNQYWRSAILEGLYQARRRHVVAPSGLVWIENRDPVLHEALRAAGRHLKPVMCIAGQTLALRT